MTYTSVKLLFCSIVGDTTYHVSSYEGKVYRISSQPYGHSLYSEEFRFTLKHPLGNPNEVAHVIYSRESRGHSFIESNLDLSNQENFPIAVVTLSDEHNERHKTKVYSIKRHRYGTMLSLDDHKNVDCCSKDVIFSFSAYNVSRTGKRKKKEKKHLVWACCSFLWVTEPEETANISRCHHLFPPEMTSEEREQKFCTVDVSLSRFGLCF